MLPEDQVVPISIPRLAVTNLCKSFPSVRANHNISFAVGAGLIHALLGENGAGKSTLVKMIYGLQSPDSGQIAMDGQVLVDGARQALKNPRAAREHGICMVFQHFCLFEAMSVLDNIALGVDDIMPRKTLAARVTKILESYSLPLDLQRNVHTLSMGERQRIEIVRALLQNPRLLIMDEPTSVLTPQEVSRLFDTLRQLAHEGCAILYISHKLHEITALCDSATILRAGEVVGSCDPRITDHRALAEMMIGERLCIVKRETLMINTAYKPRLQAKKLCLSKHAPFDIALSDIDFSIAPSEIFGIAGVAGNGQSELLLALSGEVLLSDPAMLICDETTIGKLDAEQRRSLGINAVPEERNGHAAVPDLTLTQNCFLTARKSQQLAQKGFLSTRKAKKFASDIIAHFNVKTNGAQNLARKLSGGNLQKFIMGREIMQTPRVLIVSQPTWGVDAGAASFIHEALIALANQGTAILILSQDLDELLALCDRMAVINEGRLSQSFTVKDARIEQIGLLMGGVHGDLHPKRMTA